MAFYGTTNMNKSSGYLFFWVWGVQGSIFWEISWNQYAQYDTGH